MGESNGQVTFMTSGDEGDEHASQDFEAAVGASTKFNVTVVSLDSMFEKGLPSTKTKGKLSISLQNAITYDIFYLKIDAEGYDYSILYGARNLLKSKRVKFLTFEYHSKWFSNGRTTTLKEVTHKLYREYDYECYWILTDSLVPVFGEWWQDEYEIRGWSNLFCGIKNDAMLSWIINSLDSIPKE